MRKLLLIAGAAALAASMPAVAKDKGGKGGGGGPKAEKSHKGHGGGHGGGGRGRGGNGGGHGGGWKGDKGHKEDRGGWAKREFKQERKFEKREFKAERHWAKEERKRDKEWRKTEDKAHKQWAKRDRRGRDDDRRRFREAEQRFGFDDRQRDYRRFDERREGRRFDDARRYAGERRFGLGEIVPATYFTSYNLPDEYRGWYQDSPDYSYRYDDGYIYQVDNGSSLIAALIPLLGGGFSVGNVIPAGYDAYNLPMAYRDDYQDSGDAYYRYGDDAIYQVDPQSQMIEAVVALLAGDLNVGRLLPTGYDTYNLPMEYRDQYQDSEEAIYRYADGNIYEVDPQSRMIEAIVAQLV